MFRFLWTFFNFELIFLEFFSIPHSSKDVPPVHIVVVPAGQGVQSASPRILFIVPSGQGRQGNGPSQRFCGVNPGLHPETSV